MSHRPKFRETLWFKRGQSEGESNQPTDSDVGATSAPDEAGGPDLPLEDRYIDTGAVTQTETAQFGVHVGTTQAIPLIVDDIVESDGPELLVLAKELKGRRHAVMAAIGLCTTMVIIALLAM